MEDECALLGNAIDLNFGKRLAVPVFHPVPFAPLLLENDDLIAFLVFQHGGRNGGIQHRLADGEAIIRTQEMYLVEGDAVSRIGF